MLVGLGDDDTVVPRSGESHHVVLDRHPERSEGSLDEFSGLSHQPSGIRAPPHPRILTADG
jgi:hypothetical protein